jgi:hypothetical protein
VNTRTLLKLPYQAARTPLAVLDAKLVKRLPADSPPRLAFERLIGSLDEAAGRVLKDRRVEQHGAEVRERADTLTKAVDLEQDAAQRRSAAADTVRQAEQQASELREDAQRRQREGVQAAVQNEQKEKQAASRRARVQADAAKRQADAKAASRIETVERQRKRAEAQADARKTRATAQATSTLADAAEKKATARNRRADADQLGKLRDAKQRARKSTPATGN